MISALKNTLLPRLILLATAVTFPLPIVAGPFGLEQGMALSELGEVTQSIVPGIYLLRDVPNPNPAFDEYVVQVGPQSGLCWIKAISKDITTNPYGSELKSAFNKMETIVESVYGLHKLIDGVVLGSQWEDPSDWMRGLVNEERLLAAFWDSQSGSTLPRDLVAIDMVANPASQDSGYIAIEYTFSNSANCKSEPVATAENSGP